MAIKRTPNDFRVREVLAEEIGQRVRAEPAPFAVYELSKQSLTTTDAVTLVAKAMRVPPGAVAFAGLKDKHAHTIQHITVKAGGKELPATAQARQWSVKRIGWMDEPIAASAIRGNHFEVMVRGLTRRTVEQMREAAALLAVPDQDATLRFPNYFGDQRFGSARHGQGFLARNLIKGDFEGALRLAIGVPSRKDRQQQHRFRLALAERWGHWAELLPSLPRSPERAAIEHLAKHPSDFKRAFASLPYFHQQIAVEAYQSHLWNAMAVELVSQRCVAENASVIEADDPFGNLLFPAASAIPADLLDVEVPLLGRRTELRGAWAGAAGTVLGREGVQPADLHIPGLKRPFFGEAPRRLFVDAAPFSIGNPQKDEMDPKAQRFRVRIVMQLPRGAYATVVLRALGQ